jgi:hypothetical protein
MIVHTKSELWLDAKVRLNDGTLVTVANDHPNHETVYVSDGTQCFPVLVGEAFRPDLDPLWIQEIRVEDNPKTDDYPAPDQTLQIDPLAVIFDGIDPDTFDGDILDLI